MANAFEFELLIFAITFNKKNEKQPLPTKYSPVKIIFSIYKLFNSIKKILTKRIYNI